MKPVIVCLLEISAAVSCEEEMDKDDFEERGCSGTNYSLLSLRDVAI